ncbi:hypothetical protein [Neorhizobium alkalisoli]|uniref:Uncharacterized protein n=1 Tax=Neorhizobium alkalisoli TaxID=528178 RepID=A0A561QHT5_9HYPH|nr:hypothetical protein [Neorhizobium alkalisoli]TWF49899.1 hypothetical protein FHW37_107270 [Neorhizobium alkalisoli]
MQFHAYAYQVLPGSDESLHFAKTYEECREEAADQRRELKERDPDLPPLGPMKIYQFFMRMPDEATLLHALNHPDQTATMLQNACVIERREVGTLTE